MNCFKNLCIKLFLGFVAFMGCFALDANAMETMEITEATGTTEAVEAMTIAPITTDATVDATMAVPAAPEIVEASAAAQARKQNVERLSRIIQPEGGEDFKDKVGVGLTVLHRVDSPDFPNTIEGVINEPSQYTRPAKGAILPVNLLAAEYAMELWESGQSYNILPSQFLYFAGNGKRNRFHDTKGNYYDLPEMNPNCITPYTKDPNGVLSLLIDNFLSVNFVKIKGF